jgi:hypothetical protein
MMTDDQLLNLAQEAATLVPEARNALSVELTNRKLGAQDVTKYADDLRIAQLVAEQQKPLAETLNGFGTKLYGRRNPAADGSFLTTKWVVLFWIPLIPLKSLRVKYVGETTILFGWSRKYFVLSESRCDIRQVMYTYSFILSFMIGAWVLDLIHAEPFIGCGALALWACTPWFMRWVGRP